MAFCAMMSWSGAIRGQVGTTETLAAGTVAPDCVVTPTPATVTGITYGALQNGPNITATNVTYQNDFHAVTSVSTDTAGTYLFNGPLANSVTFRRNPDECSPDNATVFYQYNTYSGSGSGSTSVFAKGDSTPTLSEVMLSNDLTQGLRNPFANGSSAQDSNIERIDFSLGSYVVQAGDGVVFFDLENIGDHGDGFRIAAYTATDGNGTPTAYANTGLLIQPGSLGPDLPTPTGTNATYLRATTTNGDDLGGTKSLATLDTNSGSPNSSDLYLVGILIRFSDLGLNVGDTIKGYSLMAGDVAPATASSLVDWDNGCVYPTDTDAASWGNADFMGFGAQVARPIPEPSTYGMILTAFGAALWCWRRSRCRV